MKKVFIINGTGGSGKDTFVDFVNKVSGGKVLNVSSVDKVKEIAKSIGWDGSKTEKDRKFLSDLKELCSQYNDMPFRDIELSYNKFLDDDMYSIMFIHIREPKAIKRAVEAFNANTILVKRDSIDTITSNNSDASVEDYCYDIKINNNGSLDDLMSTATEFYSMLN